ncbi:lytic transglycosylase domain-containing protein [Conexibacter sp. SYSU D00693]|uniref:lytic transglycosylase domain-containing protein n=1 Tax=Conexibacter sp. SYSU D00693 TaxID=2812560 RepID=UPI00196A7380|nr:lytic transglycosylase domain-containing protein [Conexibacter sp. SYSU D00693]
MPAAPARRPPAVVADGHARRLAAELHAAKGEQADLRSQLAELRHALTTALRERAAAVARADELALQRDRARRRLEAARAAAGREGGGTTSRGVAGAAAAAVLAALATIVLAGGGGDDGPAEVEPARAATPRRAARDQPLAGVPGDLLRQYRLAARRHGLDWAMLAAVGELESAHGRSLLPGVRAGTTSGGGARGPAQFVDATWERFAVDAGGDGRLDPYDPADAVHAMAAFLRASGAPRDWDAALRAYNPSTPGFANRVRARAADLRARAAAARRR